MCPIETPVYASLAMDRSEPLGNSDDGSGRRALHVRSLAQLVSEKYDAIYATYPSSVVEVYTYKLTGTTVATVTVTYTTATKDVLDSVRT
jgi:hypothetical protein